MTYFIFPIFVVDEENAQIQRECFESFKIHTPPTEGKIIIIDNGSNFGLKDAAAFSDIYMRFPAPIGFAKAVNIGWEVVDRLGDGDFVGVLNNDLVFREGWFDGLLDNIDNNTAAVAPSDYPMEGVNDHIWSSCFFQSVETRKKIGLFDDKELPYRYHDQDYWIRAKKLRLEFKRIGKNRVSHKESTTYKKMVRANPAIKESELREEEVMRKRHGVSMAQFYDINKLSTKS